MRFFTYFIQNESRLSTRDSMRDLIPHPSWLTYDPLGEWLGVQYDNNEPNGQICVHKVNAIRYIN